jgi:hypothetical protein
MVTLDGRDGEHGDAVAYVLGALEAPARIRFEGHALGCAECSGELAELQPVADALGLAVPQVDPPAYIRNRLLMRAQLTQPDFKTMPLTPPEAQVAARGSRWRIGERFATGLAAVSVVVALASGSYGLMAHRELERTTQETQAATRAAAQLSETLSIMYQPGVVPKVLEATEMAPRAKAKMYLVPDGTKAVVMAYDLPPLQRGEAYQCWLANRNDDGRQDAGLFAVDNQGRGHWMLNTPQAMMFYRWIGVTREPAGGSKGPTGPRVLGGQL